ncbi:hypothetical protein [Enterococcus ureasiticus]|uniref:Uncharacterized protein n=1 Tax=Enterococcus ureasiticus TaxID=903984 RepID=A0A1E5GL97_9ENTE|nr:hypothetical protein [Enterococcus ureasiticus]OEG13441.1 hypothetical protein BCR21_00155 [Enterococcus ureasiticus]
MLFSIFVDHKGDFQWASIAAIVSFIGFITTLASTVWINKKTIRASVQSKTNIEWINQIRRLSAELIYNYELVRSSATFSFGTKIKIVFIESEIEKEDNKMWTSGIVNIYPQEQKKALIKSKRSYDEKYNENIGAASLATNQLLLYFIDDDKHSNLIDLIAKLRASVVKIADFSRERIETGQPTTYYEDMLEKQSKYAKELDDLINEFRNEVALYLKIEWENVKSGK